MLVLRRSLWCAHARRGHFTILLLREHIALLVRKEALSDLVYLLPTDGPALHSMGCTSLRSYQRRAFRSARAEGEQVTTLLPKGSTSLRLFQTKVLLLENILRRENYFLVYLSAMLIMKRCPGCVSILKTIRLTVGGGIN